MFGMGGLFSTSGGDVNAASMDGEANNGGYGNDNTGGGYGNSPGPDSMSRNEDPAQTAARNAEYSANATTQDTKAQSTSGKINAPNGNALISGLFQAFDSKAKKVARKQRVLSRAQAQAAVDNSVRAQQQYAVDSERQRQQLQQSYAGRGIGESSIQQSGMDYFNETAARKAAELDQNITLASMGKELTYSQISASYAQPYMHTIGGVLNMV